MATLIKATFKGEDGSCGFTRNENYDLEFSIDCSGKVSILHQRPGNLVPYQIVPYANFKSFLNNWVIIKAI